uniref:Uncharacterized protein n=1 Tax=Maylandia zebra TaxID=106582 RepID=A0A3P9B3F3_9CICH
MFFIVITFIIIHGCFGMVCVWDFRHWVLGLCSLCWSLVLVFPCLVRLIRSSCFPHLCVISQCLFHPHQPRLVQPSCLHPHQPRLVQPSCLHPHQPRLVQPSCLHPRLVRPSCLHHRLVRPSCLHHRLVRPSCLHRRLVRPSLLFMAVLGWFVFGILDTGFWVCAPSVGPWC